MGFFFQVHWYFGAETWRRRRAVLRNRRHIRGRVQLLSAAARNDDNIRRGAVSVLS